MNDMIEVVRYTEMQADGREYAARATMEALRETINAGRGDKETARNALLVNAHETLNRFVCQLDEANAEVSEPGAAAHELFANSDFLVDFLPFQ